MPLRKLGRQAREAFEVPRDLLLGRYPAFVTGGRNFAASSASVIAG